MGLQLLSISHKAAPLSIRSFFAFSEEQLIQIMLRLKEHTHIKETVVLTTCNRTEITVYSDIDKERAKVFQWMEQVLLEQTDVSQTDDIGAYIRLYQDERAVHHIFQVAAGLDSMVIGEDQILGQMKRAYDYAHQYHMCGTYLNTLFRYAITGAKKVKTATLLSKTSVSIATLTLKAAEKCIGTLQEKKLMLIGATGSIGNTILKNAACIKGLSVYVTARNHSLPKEGHHKAYIVIPYEERYKYLNDMDVIISATSSPHYTLTKQQIEKALVYHKKRVFVDLAVPMDIESGISKLQNTAYYNMENFSALAEENNRKKQSEAKEAGLILEDYEIQFQKWMLFQRGLPEMDGIKSEIMERMKEKGIEKALDSMFYDIREAGSVKELERFYSILAKVLGK